MSNAIFTTLDVFSQPSTQIFIVDQLSPQELRPGVCQLHVSAVEVTEGWLHRDAKNPSSVCFKHSFGKCGGKTGNNPASCLQVHVNRAALDALRATYVNPPRQFFTRTVKVTVDEILSSMMCQVSQRPMKLQYLEFRTADVVPTAGMLQYEQAYREWLFSNDSVPDGFHFATTMCWTYAAFRACPHNDQCMSIHVDAHVVLSKDRCLMTAIRHVCDGLRSSHLRQQVPPPIVAVLPPGMVHHHQASMAPVQVRSMMHQANVPYFVQTSPDNSSQMPLMLVVYPTPQQFLNQQDEWQE